MSKIFKSEIYQNENGIIDASKLYKDAEEWIEEEKKRKGVERLHRWHPLAHLFNSTSGNYCSPTAMKSFMACPAGYLYSKLVPEKIGSATSVGSTFHSIMQNFYNLPGEERTYEKIIELMNKQIELDNQEDSAKAVKDYVDGYWDAPDYITGRPMDHKKLICSNEVFIKPKINPLGVDLNVPVYTLLDRIDVRDDGIYIIDYKTGMGDPNPYLLGEYGYLPQMIFYSWAVESEYGQKPKKVMLCLPGASMKYKYVDMNIHSLVEQSKVVEKVHNYLIKARNVRESLKFDESIMRYCNSCQMKMMCKTYLESKNLDLSNFQEIIPVEIEIEDQYGEGNDII